MLGLYKIDKPDDKSVLTFSILSDSPYMRLNDNNSNNLEELLIIGDRIQSGGLHRFIFDKSHHTERLEHLTIDIENEEGVSEYFDLQHTLSPIGLHYKGIISRENDMNEISAANHNRNDNIQMLPMDDKQNNIQNEYSVKTESQDNALETPTSHKGDVESPIKKLIQLPTFPRTPQHLTHLKPELRLTTGINLSPKSINKFTKLTLETGANDSPQNTNNKVTVEKLDSPCEVDGYNFNRISDRIRFSNTITIPEHILSVTLDNDSHKNEHVVEMGGDKIGSEFSNPHEVSSQEDFAPQKDEPYNMSTLKERSRFIESFFNIRKATSIEENTNKEDLRKSDTIINSNNLESRSSRRSNHNVERRTSDDKYIMTAKGLVESELVGERSSISNRPTISSNKIRPSLTLDISLDDNDSSVKNQAFDLDIHSKKKGIVQNSISGRNEFLKDTQLEDLQVAQEKKSELIALRDELLQFCIVNRVLSNEKNEFDEAIHLINKEISEMDILIKKLIYDTKHIIKKSRKTNHNITNALDHLEGRNRIILTNEIFFPKDTKVKNRREEMVNDSHTSDKYIPNYNSIKNNFSNKPLSKDNTTYRHRMNVTKMNKESQNQNMYASKTQSKKLSINSSYPHLNNTEANRKNTDYITRRATNESHKSSQPYIMMRKNITSKDHQQNYLSTNNKQRIVMPSSIKDKCISRDAGQVSKWSTHLRNYNKILKEEVDDEYFGPAINTRPMQHFEELKKQTTSQYKLSMERKRHIANKSVNNMLRVSIDGDIENCTFTPYTYSKRLNINGSFDRRAAEWTAKKQAKLEGKRLQKSRDESEQIKKFFKPHLNTKSIEIMGNVRTSFDQRNAEHIAKLHNNRISNSTTNRKPEKKLHIWIKEVIEIKSLFKLLDKLPTKI